MQKLHSIYFYVFDATLREAAADGRMGGPAHIMLRPCLGELGPIVGNITRPASHALAEEEGNSALLADDLARTMASM